MSFPKEKLHEELRKQVLAMVPALAKMRFTNAQDGHYWDEFYHRRSHVRVKVVAIKESWGYYGGFKLKLERGDHPGRGSSVVMVKIDNLAAVRTAIKDSISYIRKCGERAREVASFKRTLEKTVARLFPGRDPKVYSADRGQQSISVGRKDGAGPWFDVRIGTDGTVSEVKIAYPGKALEQVAKLLEAW